MLCSDSSDCKANGESFSTFLCVLEVCFSRCLCRAGTSSCPGFVIHICREAYLTFHWFIWVYSEIVPLEHGCCIFVCGRSCPNIQERAAVCTLGDSSFQGCGFSGVSEAVRCIDNPLMATDVSQD